ncbi:MAG: phytanoyl-CoA dioxygenase family protein [Gammaproteobacteria bacterium]|nr:phytanoyl-CoA dioxygenase family protein [Gammaproteobacteria bacterium]
MTLTPGQVSDFQRRGFIVLQGFIPPADIGKVGEWLDRLAASTPGSGPEARYYEKSPVTGRNLLVRVEYFMGPGNAEVSRLLLSPKAEQALAQLLGEPAVLFKEKVNYKLPGCRADKLHQDQAAGWNAYCDFFITMAVVVDANRRDNAALSFLQTGRYQKSLMTPEWQPLTHDDPPYSPPEDYALLEANPGDVVFFDSYVPHGSPPNTSERQRRNIYLTFNRRSAGDLRQRYYEDKWANYPPNSLAEARADDSYRV